MRLAITRLTPLSRVVYSIADFRQEGYIRDMSGKGAGGGGRAFQWWER